MADDSRPLFNFYLRYPWGPADFEQLQDSLVGITRDSFAELHGAALFEGGIVAPSGSVSGVTVTALTAVNEDGFLLVTDETRFVDLSDGHATLARIDLLVARPLLSTGAQISRPTSPNDTVTLTELQQCQLIAIAGTPAGSPVAPAKVAGDVILAAITVPALATSIISGNIDRTTQEVGKAVRWDPAGRTVTPPSGTVLPGLIGVSTGAAYGLEGHGGVYGLGSADSIHGVTGQGSGAGKGGRFIGQGDGSGATDDAIQSYQNIHMSGESPAATVGITNRITPKSVVKAWGRVNCQVSGSPILVDGLNITSVANESNLGVTGILVTLADDMANPNYAVVASCDYDTDVDSVHPININAGSFRIHAKDSAALTSLGNSGAFVNFYVMGEQ